MRGAVSLLIFGLALSAAASTASAALPEGPPPTLATAWTLSAWTLLPLALVICAYAVGLYRARAQTGRVCTAGPCEVARFAGGLAVLGLALVWPLDAFGMYALSAHVAQHMLLLAFAPPLLLAGRPLPVLAAALPAKWTGRMQAASRRTLPVVRALAPATVAHGGAMLVWHLPGATSAALADVSMHRMMSASFLVAGLWFWAALWHRRRTDAGAVGGLVALVTVMMLMGFLGALLTFSPRLLYPVYSDRSLLIGLDPLRDQQLAGLLMWVPTGIPYVAAGLALVVVLLRRARDRAAPVAD